MSRLFAASRINKLELSNRLVRSATWESLASDDGAVTGQLTDAMAELARGGVGLIITGHAYVSRDGQAGMRQLGVYDDKLIPGLQQMVAAVHQHGGKIVLQIAHSGRMAPCQLTGQPALTVSLLAQDSANDYREISHQDIEDLVAAFAQAACRAKEAGFDGVQVHCAHGYLLSQFLSPAFNQRCDKYGGDIINRTRIHQRIVTAIRETVGSDYPLLIKMNGQDYVEEGLTIEDSVQAGKILAQAGVDAIEISGGITRSNGPQPSQTGIIPGKNEAYFRNEARRFKAEVSLPLILVGGIRSLEAAEELLENGAADYIALSRPLIYEPDLINRWKSGDYRPALCKSDNLCLKSGRAGTGVYCVVREHRDSLSL